MIDDDKFAHHFVGAGYSDDCGSLTGSQLPDGTASSEYEDCHNWFEFKINGEVVGECMMNYDHGWEFRLRSDTHTFEAGKLLRHGDGEPWEG